MVKSSMYTNKRYCFMFVPRIRTIGYALLCCISSDSLQWITVRDQKTNLWLCWMVKQLRFNDCILWRGENTVLETELHIVKKSAIWNSLITNHVRFVFFPSFSTSKSRNNVIKNDHQNQIGNTGHPVAHTSKWRTNQIASFSSIQNKIRAHFYSSKIFQFLWMNTVKPCLHLQTYWARQKASNM